MTTKFALPYGLDTWVSASWARSPRRAKSAERIEASIFTMLLALSDVASPHIAGNGQGNVQSQKQPWSLSCRRLRWIRRGPWGRGLRCVPGDNVLDDAGQVRRVVDDVTCRKQARSVKAVAGEGRAHGDDVHPSSQGGLHPTGRIFDHQAFAHRNAQLPGHQLMDLGIRFAALHIVAGGDKVKGISQIEKPQYALSLLTAGHRGQTHLAARLPGRLKQGDVVRPLIAV